MKLPNVVILIMVLAAMVLGCSSSSEPTESEIAKVIQYQVDNNQFVAAEIKANYATLEVKKLSCKAQNDPTGLPVAMCTVELTADKPFASSGTNKITDQIAMTKGNEGWVVHGGMYMIK